MLLEGFPVNRPGGLRRRVARWLDPTVGDAFTAVPTGAGADARPVSPGSGPGPGPDPDPPGPDPATAAAVAAAKAWPALCEQFALRILSAAYQTGGQLAAVEADEQDPGRLAQFYRIDHANTRIRRQAENLLVLAGRPVDDAGRQITSLVDVVRAASSAIEHYSRVRLGILAHLAVVDFAADDVIRILTEVLDNATRFSPPNAPVTVSAHLTEAGSVLMRVEDSGLGFSPGQLRDVNAMLASAMPLAVAGARANRLGLLVVQRLAAAHRIGVRLTARPGGGTTATALLPAGLLCEVPSAQDGPTPPPHQFVPGGQRPAGPGPGPGRPTPPPPPPPPLPAPPQLPLHPVAGSPGQANGAGRLAQANGGGPAAGRVGAGPVGQLNGGRPAQFNGAGPNGHVNDGGPNPGGLPRREPASLRGDPPPAPTAPGGPSVGSDQLAWPEETLDFAAGFRDGRQPHTSTEGHRDDQPSQ